MWEIYLGDVIGAVQTTDRIVSIANTDYGLKISGTAFTLHWQGKKIGEIQVATDNNMVSIGRLKVDKVHRGSGISRVLMLAIYAYGILKGCTNISFNDPFASTELTESQLIGFWSSVGMAGESQTLKITNAMARLFAKQGQFALIKGLAYTPNTVFLNPFPTIAPTQSSFVSGKPSAMVRRGSFGM